MEPPTVCTSRVSTFRRMLTASNPRSALRLLATVIVAVFAARIAHASCDVIPGASRRSARPACNSIVRSRAGRFRHTVERSRRLLSRSRDLSRPARRRDHDRLHGAARRAEERGGPRRQLHGRDGSHQMPPQAPSGDPTVSQPLRHRPAAARSAHGAFPLSRYQELCGYDLRGARDDCRHVGRSRLLRHGVRAARGSLAGMRDARAAGMCRRAVRPGLLAALPPIRSSATSPPCPRRTISRRSAPARTPPAAAPRITSS